MIGAIIVGLAFAASAGIVAYLFLGPLMAGRYEPPDERRRENRHKYRRKATATGRRSG